MSDPAGRDLRILQAAADAELRRLVAPVGARLVALTERHAEPGPDGKRIVTSMARARIMAGVDDDLATIFGQARGGHSSLEELIVDHANRARRRPIAAAVARIRKLVPADLFAAMRKG